MEDQISRTIGDSIKILKDSWSNELAEIRSILQELVGSLATNKPTPVEFQRFCGENPELWISQVQCYFDFYEIAETHKLSIASSYLDGAALTWYEWLFQNKQLSDWEHFTAKALIRFRNRHLESPEDRLANLRKVTSVTEYESLLEAFSSDFGESGVFLPHVSNITTSPLPQCNDEKSECKSDTDAHQVFDTFPHKAEQSFTELSHTIDVLENIGPVLNKNIVPEPEFYGNPSLIISDCELPLVISDGGGSVTKYGDEEDSNTYVGQVFNGFSYGAGHTLVEHKVFESLGERSDLLILAGIRLMHDHISIHPPFDPGESIPPSIPFKCGLRQFGTLCRYAGTPLNLEKEVVNILRIDYVASVFEQIAYRNASIFVVFNSYLSEDELGWFEYDCSDLPYFLACCLDQCLSYQFSFNHGVHRFVVTVRGTAPDLSVWDPGICSKSMTLTELSSREAVFPRRRTLFVLLFALHNEHKVRHMDKNVSRKFVVKVITESSRSYLTDYYFKDSLQPNFLISLVFAPMHEVYAVSSDYSVSSFVVSDAKLGSCGLLCFTLLFLIVVKRVFQQQNELTVLTTCSTEMVEFIQLKVHNDYWIDYFTRPITDVFVDALAITLHPDVVISAFGEINREGIAQVLQGVEAGKTWVNFVQVTFEMTVDFDPGGSTCGVPILEDKDGVLEIILKAIADLFVYTVPLSFDNADDHHLKATTNDITNCKFGLSRLGLYLRESHYPDNIRPNGLPCELCRQMKGHYNNNSMVYLRMFETLELYPATNGLVETMLGRFSALSRKSNVHFTTMNLKGELLEKKGCQGNLVSTSMGCYGLQDTTMIFRITKVAMVNIITHTVVASKYWTVGFFLVCRWTRQPVAFAPVEVDIATTSLSITLFAIFRDSTLEDKVLIEGGSIVMNQPIGPRRSNRTRRPSQRLIWDPGPISNCLKRTGARKKGLCVLWKKLSVPLISFLESNFSSPFLSLSLVIVILVFSIEIQ